MAKAVKKSTGAKKAAKKGGKKQASSKGTFNIYIKRVLKGGKNPQLGLSSTAVKIINSFVVDMFDKIATQAAALARLTKKATLGSREVQTAVRLLVPGELASHCMSEASKSVAAASK